MLYNHHIHIISLISSDRNFDVSIEIYSEESHVPYVESFESPLSNFNLNAIASHLRTVILLSSIVIVVVQIVPQLTSGNIFIKPILFEVAIAGGYVLVLVDLGVVVEIVEFVHRRVIITCRLFSSPVYYLLRRVAGAGCRYQEDDEASQQEPAVAGGQSQGGGKRAHRPRGANQPPKPTTDGASTSFPFACSPLPPSRPPDLPGAPSHRRCPREKRLTSRSSCVRLRTSVSPTCRRNKRYYYCEPAAPARAYASSTARLHVIHQRVLSSKHCTTSTTRKRRSFRDCSKPLRLVHWTVLAKQERGRSATAAARGRYSGATAPRFAGPHHESIESTGLVAVDLPLRRETRDACMLISFIGQADGSGFLLFLPRWGSPSHFLDINVRREILLRIHLSSRMSVSVCRVLNCGGSP